MIIRSIALYSAIHWFGAWAVAQPEVQVKVAKGWNVAAQQQPQVFFKELQDEFTGRTYDPRAATLLRTAEAFTKMIFTFPGLQFERAVTYRRGSADIMVAQWGVDAQSQGGTLILKDTPSRSWYALRLSRRALATREDLAAFLGEVLICRKPPLHVSQLELTVPSATGIAAFSGSFTFSEFSYQYGVYLAGVTTNTEWFLNVNVGKALTKRYYPIPPYVAERFPALSELARSWSSEKLWLEVGRAADPDFQSTDDRDRILIEELARRGLSADQFSDLMVSTDHGHLGNRAIIVLSALRNAGKHSLLTSYVAPVLARYERLGSRAEEAVSNLFRYAADNCSPQFETVALKTLKGGIFGEGPLIYFSRCTSSEELLRAIEAAPVQDRLIEWKKHALWSIQRRRNQKQK